MHPQILQNIRQRLYYHGTDRASAAAIIAHGFRLPAENRGYLGRGVYITANPGTAMYFGQVVLQVELRCGLRLLDTDMPFDVTVIRRLKREFGREILEKAPRLVLPAKKRLTVEEAVALFLYHSHKGHFWTSLVRGNPFVDTAPTAYRLHREMRSLLLRYGFDGYGEADTFGGIVLFSPDSARAIDVVIDLPDAEYEADTYLDFNNGCSSEDGASPHRTVGDAHARLKELFPRQSARDWQGNVLAPQTTPELER